jgi:uncharacterized protein involved in exopolysaccharide biosynthesis/Mrp family chromosome partitioning ATPase
MDFAYLVNILLKRKWLLLSVVLLASVATWFLVGKLPPTYKAKAVISTGIIDYKGVSIQRDNPFIQKFQIESAFNGLIEKMKSRNSIKLLSDKLLLHDLGADGINSKPFRVPDNEDSEFSASDFENYAQTLKTHTPDSSVKATFNEVQTNNRIAEAFQYDYESLLKKLEIKRVGETDLMTIEYEAESPDLSYFAVRTFVEEFFKMHEADLSSEEDMALKFHTSQVENKKRELDAKIEEINNYKKTHGLVDVGTQRESAIGLLDELNLKREEEASKIPALKTSIAILNEKLKNYTKATGEQYANLVFFTDDYQVMKDEIQRLQEKQVELVATGKSTAAVEVRIEELQRKLSNQIQNTPALTSKKRQERIDIQVEKWITESLEKQMALEFAQEAVASYDNEIRKINSKANQLIINDNELATLEADKNRMQEEYLSAKDEYDKSRMFSEGTENPLTIIEPAEMPDEPEPSHRAVFSAFAGVASGTMASIVLFLLAFMDSTMQSPSQFQRTTKLPLLGYVNRVKVRNMNLQQLFAHTQGQGDLENFKENIRKLRTAVENSGAKSFLFVSPKEQEGKSFLIVLLAYALSLNNKRILIVDTNFKNNTLSGFKTKSFIEITTDPTQGFLKGIGTGFKQLPPPAGADMSDPQLKNIDIIGNKGGSQSPSEILAGKDFSKVMEQYGRKYDFIFMEAAALNKFSDGRELLNFAEKIIAVFSTQMPISNADKDTFEFLRSLNGKMLGGILNNVDLKNL